MFGQSYLSGCKVITVFSRPSKGLLYSQNQASIFVEWWKYLHFYCLLQNFTDKKGFTGTRPWKGLCPQQRDIYSSIHISALRRNTNKCHDSLDSKGKNLYVLWAISHPGDLRGFGSSWFWKRSWWWKDTLRYLFWTRCDVVQHNRKTCLWSCAELYHSCRLYLGCGNQLATTALWKLINFGADISCDPYNRITGIFFKNKR